MNPDPSTIAWALLRPPLQLWVFIASYKANVPAFVLSSSPVAWVSFSFLIFQPAQSSGSTGGRATSMPQAVLDLHSSL